MSGDLHCHSSVSDGSIDPCRIVDLASRLKLECVAITDHDTMEGVKAAVSYGAKIGVKVIPGLEISTFDFNNKRKAHILCYMPKNPAPLLEFCAETLKNRTAASLEIIQILKKTYPIDTQTVKEYSARSTAIYKQHIMLALMNMGYSLSVFGEFYKNTFSSHKGWPFTNTHLPDTRDAVRIAKESGGAVVLAHPGLYGNFDIVDELCGLGLDGIEVFHPRQSEVDTKRAFEAAEKHNLIRTGGSDFHGMCASQPTWLGQKQIEDSEFTKLVNRFG